VANGRADFGLLPTNRLKETQLPTIVKALPDPNSPATLMRLLWRKARFAAPL